MTGDDLFIETFVLMDTREKYYTQRKQKYANRLRALKRRSRLFVTAEIVSFAAFVAFLVMATTGGHLIIGLSMAALSMIVYVAVRKTDAANALGIEHVEALIAVNERELKYIHGDFSDFDDGARYVDAHHPFSFDLDVFGSGSLYNRICRTVTTDGSDRLARWLSLSAGEDDKHSAASVKARREAVDELAGLVEWREEFMASAVGDKIDTHKIVTSIKAVRQMRISAAPASVPSLVTASTVLMVFFILILLSASGYVPSAVPVMWGILQFFIVLMVCSGSLRKISRTVDNLHKHMRACHCLVALICSLDGEKTVAGSEKECAVRSEELLQLARRLDDALVSFRDMDRILGDIDRRANLLGLIFFDMFMLSDFFLVRRFLLWRNRYEDRFETWIESIGRMDALVSMATLRYNETSAVAAEVVDSDRVVYDATALYHPFVGKNAVKNDFSLAHNNYYIITGANMAGKSTFLRTIGVNYILALNGMPVFAERLKVSVFSLFTSMRTTDDLTHGISYFNAELLRLRQLMDYCASRSNTLIILDEILKGTNSVDKLNGSRLFLEYMSGQNVTGIVATHDLELSKMADTYPSVFHNYCFEIELGTGVSYSYKITPGVARNQNATFLLKNILAGRDDIVSRRNPCCV